MRKLEDLQSNAAKEKEEYCQNVTKEIENLEMKLVETEAIEREIADLKSSREFMSENAIAEAQQQISKAHILRQSSSQFE